MRKNKLYPAEWKQAPQFLRPQVHTARNQCALTSIDIELPKMNGSEILRLIKAGFSSDQGRHDHGSFRRVSCNGIEKTQADDFIGKPYDISEIISTIKKLRGVKEVIRQVD